MIRHAVLQLVYYWTCFNCGEQKNDLVKHWNCRRCSAPRDSN